MSSAHVSGVRLPFAQTPRHVLEWVERELGAELWAVTDVVGGMSPGPAARVQATNGRRAFVKTCGSSLNPDTPGLLRAEVSVLECLPRHPNLPRLQASYDDGDWVGLMLDDIDAPLVRLPWSRVDFARVSRAITEIHVATSPNPWPAAPPAALQSASFFSRWRALVAQPPGDLSAWWRTNLEPLAGAASLALDVIDGDALLHWDVRADNILADATQVVLVDWGQARLGPPWMDHALLALDAAVSGGDVTIDHALTVDPVLQEVDPAALLSVTAAMTMAFELRWRQPPVQGLPTLGDTSRRWSLALQPVLDRLLALTSPVE